VNRDIPDALEKIIFKALAKDPDDRYQWATELSEALQRFMLQNGKPPGRIELGKYLRENFTVDYDRHRLRMETFREIQMPAPVVNTATGESTMPLQVPAGLDRGSAAVLAALRDDAGQEIVSDEEDSGFLSRSDRTPSNAVMPRPGDSGLNSILYPREGTNPALRDSQPGISTIRPALSTSSQVTGYPTRSPGESAFRFVGIALMALTLTLAAGYGAFRIALGRGTLLITSQPSDVAIFLDGQALGVTTGGTLNIPDIQSGRHDVAAQKDGYVPFSGKITILKNSATNMPLRLDKLPDPIGRLDVMSTPSGAAIFVDGRPTGKQTPAVIDTVVANLEHKIVLQLEDYFEATQAVVVATDETKRVEIELKARFMSVQVRSEPSGASVFRDGELRALGKTPLTLDKLDPQGPAPKIILRHPRCRPYPTTIALNEEEPTMLLNITLTCR
jgi:hypothetical protein